jgi:hypothetical protein
MARVLACLPRLEARGSFERNKEVYVVSFASSANAGPGAATAPTIGSNNETLARLVPDLMDHSAMQWVVPAVSNVFTRVRRGQPVSLTGSGIILYPNLDPGALLGLHFAVVESDAGTRGAGKVLGEVFNAAPVKEALKAISAAAATGTPQIVMANVMAVLVSQLPGALERNRDDVLFAHTHSGGDYDDYGVSERLSSGTLQQDFPLSNDQVSCTLRIRVNP